MTDTAAAAEWRWALAAERAERVLDGDAQPRVSLPLVAGALVVAVGALVVVATSFGPDDVGRWLTAIVGAVTGLLVVVVEVVRALRERARPSAEEPVMKGLLRREQSAVVRSIRRRSPVPDDRLDVVRATAVQQARGRTLPAACAQPLVWTGLAVSGVDLWQVYAVLAMLWVLIAATTFREVLLARRFLGPEPERS